MAISIASGTKLKASIVPLMSWRNNVIKVKNPNSENISCMLTRRVEKYDIRLPKERLNAGPDCRCDALESGSPQLARVAIWWRISPR